MYQRTRQSLQQKWKVLIQRHLLTHRGKNRPLSIIMNEIIIMSNSVTQNYCCMIIIWWILTFFKNNIQTFS